jgi:hypothetical protein
MNKSKTELWRVKHVVCELLPEPELRRIRVRRGDIILSDQTFTYPDDAMESARELRFFFEMRSAAPEHALSTASVTS